MYLVGERPESAWGNLLLTSLPQREQGMIAPLLTRQHFANGTALSLAQGANGFVYFPETAVVCVVAPGVRQGVLGLGVIGREGVFGWSALFGGDCDNQHGTVRLNDGSALAIEKWAFARLCANEPQLLRALLRFSCQFSLQLAETLASNVRDPIEVRLCRWILLFHDRLDDNEMSITHDILADLLAVRRATVTDALHILEGERLLRCTRGRIFVRARRALQDRAGDAYQEAGGADDTVVERSSERA